MATSVLTKSEVIIPQKTTLFIVTDVKTQNLFFSLLKSWTTQIFITIKTSLNTND
jgi:hypothetical protein